jgi:RHS repeat-associated protein
LPSINPQVLIILAIGPEVRIVVPGYPATLFQSGLYSSLGGLATGSLGNGATETFYYTKMDRLGCERVVNGTTTLYSAALSSANGQCSGMSTNGYSGNGDVITSQDFVNGNWSYKYDDLNHLVWANATAGPWAGDTMTWSYDRYGNRWTQTLTGTTGQSLSFTLGNNRINGYGYDADGNLLNDGTNGYLYDDENRVSTANLGSGGSLSYSYDAEGQRIRKQLGSAIDEYVFDPAGHEIGDMTPLGAFNRVEIYAGERHLVTYNSTKGQAYFVHSDWQGTERVRSNYTGGSYESCWNTPHGDNLTCTNVLDVSPLHYTGKQRDTETNLDYFGARYYSSGMARWMSPDWADKPTTVPYASFGDPQSLNLYGYVTNNPVSKMDDDGHLFSFTQWLNQGSSSSPYSGSGPPGSSAEPEGATQEKSSKPISSKALIKTAKKAARRAQKAAAKAAKSISKISSKDIDNAIKYGVLLYFPEADEGWIGEQISSAASKVDNIITDHMAEEDLAGAAQELATGEKTVGPDGKLYSHVTEIEQALNGLNNKIEHAERLLKRADLSERQTEALTSILSTAREWVSKGVTVLEGTN